MNQPNYNPFFEIGSEHIQLGMFGLFVIFRFLRWNQLQLISVAHKVLGQAVLLVLLIGIALMGYGPKNVTLFRIMVYSALAAWEAFNYWYFEGFPIPLEHLRTTRKITIPNLPLFLPKRALLKYLLSPPTSEPYWTRHRFRNVALWFGGVFLLFYSFSGKIETYTQGQKELAKAKQQAALLTDSSVKFAVQAAVDSTKKALLVVVDTLKQGQTNLSNQVVHNGEQDKNRAAVVKKAFERANRTRTSPVQIIISQPKPKSMPQSNFPLPEERVRPFRKGQKFGTLDSAARHPTPDAQLAKMLEYY